VRLVVYDVLGREVRVLEDGVIGAGEHRAVWDGCNDLGKRVTSGVYFYKLEAGDHQFTRKMLVVR
jgi:flagellar hook assembly protein FlgD